MSMPDKQTSKDTKSGGARCIVCGGAAVDQFLDLGETALANKFLTVKELSQQEVVYPLRTGFCHTCGHVQLMEAVPPSAMFEDYLYISSASDTLKAHLYDLSDLLAERYHLTGEDLVIDIGCNDGTLLQGFRRHGVRTLGVDPAANLAELTRANGIERYVGFFNSETAKTISDKWGQAALITATNTFPHIPDLADFIDGIKNALAPGGVFVIEAHYLVDLLEQGAFDTIYHEHVSYWALGPMTSLFAQHDMEVVQVERMPLHHGQLRVAVQRCGDGGAHASVAELLAMERALGINQFATYQRFAQQTHQLKVDLHRTLKDLRAQRRQVVGYGAPAKGNTLLGFLEIGPELVPYIADRSPLKQGLYTPGTHILVVPPERLLADQPDYVLLLAWNFAEEVMAQQVEYQRRGGRFIMPVPHVQIL
jgi:SAM-dependent methyltransferase